MKKLKRLLTILLCLVMLMPSVIAAQANESDSLTVKPATTYTIKGLKGLVQDVVDENGNHHDEVEVEFDLTFEECYGVIQVYTNQERGIENIPVVREGSKMHFKPTKNRDYLRSPFFKYKLVDGEYGRDFAESSIINPLPFAMHLCYNTEENCAEYWGWRSIEHVEFELGMKLEDILTKESDNEYCYTMFYGLNLYMADSDRRVCPDVEHAWLQTELITALSVNDKQIKELKETGKITYIREPIAEWSYTYSYPGLYELLFGEETPNFDFSNIDIKGYKCIYKSESEIQFLYRLTNNNAEDVLSSFIIIPIKYENKTPVSFSGYASVRVKLPANSEKIGVLSIDTSENSANFKIYDDDSHIEVPETIFTSNSSVNGAIIIQCSDKNEETSIIEELESNYILPMETRKTLSDEEVSIGLQYLKNLIVKGDIQKL